MKTLLVLAPHPELAEAVRAGLNPEEYRVLHRSTPEEAEPLLAGGVADACIVDVELTSVQGVWLLDKLRRHAPKCPLLIYAGAKQWEWEEEAYLRGVAHVLTKPVRGRMLAAVLSRLWPTPTASGALPATGGGTASIPPASTQRTGVETAGSAQALSVLRDFSRILTHSLNAEGMLKQFLLLLREILGINRAAIFLRSPGERRLRSASAMGLPAGLLEHFELTLESGIGGSLFRLGRILRRNSDEARNEPLAQKEFELLSGQVAVPILDRENVIGVAVLDGRVTGEPLVNAELELIFHLLEQLGLGIKNIWLHDQSASSQEMMAGILRELSSACVVVNRDLAILHANRMARKYFTRAERLGAELEFSDLPQVLGAKIYQVLKTGAAVSNFKYEAENGHGTVYNVHILPFQRGQGGLPVSALLLAEDLTQSLQLQRLEIEAANLRLIRSMADRLTHEIGNALVPLLAHRGMLADKLGKKTLDLDYLKVMERALGEGIKRVERLVNQMRFLALEGLASADAFQLAPLIEEAFQEAREYQPVKAAQLKYETGGAPLVVTGDRKALKHALAEVMLNALQANPSDPKIGVRLNPESVANGGRGLQIEVQDNGAGFTLEAAQKATTPFFTTRNVGVGLGLTVTKKIVETHHGKLEIPAPKQGQTGLVRISLPLNPASEEKS
jgi:signal transduction histidine kinase